MCIHGFSRSYGEMRTLFAAYAKVRTGRGVRGYGAKLYFLDSDAFRRWAHLPNSSSELVKHVALRGEKPLRWAMKPGECVTLRGHHDDRIMHQAGVTNALRDGVRLKLIQRLGKPGHINGGKSERTCYLPWFFLSSENSHVR